MRGDEKGGVELHTPLLGRGRREGVESSYPSIVHGVRASFGHIRALKVICLFQKHGAIIQ